MKSVTVTGMKHKGGVGRMQVPIADNRYLIAHNDKPFLDGSGILIPMVWNNIIGVNSKTEKDHLNYLTYMEVLSGMYKLVRVSDGFVIDSCTIQVN